MDSSNSTATRSEPARQSWIERFVEVTEGVNSPRIFRKWAAIACVAGAMERKVWIKTGRRIIWPNLYIILVAPPGVGKSQALTDVNKFWTEVENIFVAPVNLTRAGIIDELIDSERSVFRPQDVGNPLVKFNCLNAVISELGTFMTAYEGEFMSTLNHLYDGEPYDERKRHIGKRLELHAPLLTIIGGTTPAWLGGTLPPHAWAEGFCSRLIMIYSGERQLVDLFADVDEVGQDKELVSRLRDINDLYGPMKVEPEAAKIIQEWYASGGHPQPEHPKLEHYITRRPIHLIKIIMALSVSRSTEMVIRVCDVNEGIETLLEAETTLPDIFRAMNASGDGSILDDAYAHSLITFAKYGRQPLPEHIIIQFLAKKLPAHSVLRSLELMVQNNMLRCAGAQTVGGRKHYIPVPRDEHSI